MDNYKEKYEQALLAMRRYNEAGIIEDCYAESIFPELKESEDERIRKALIEHFRWNVHQILNDFNNKEVLTWLEKQGEIIKEWSEMKMNNIQTELQEMVDLKQCEQKPADKDEPKFHEGEWITNGDYTWKIVEVKPLDYILQSQEGNIVDDTISHVDGQFHSFTIEDAKDGDVLCTYERGEPKIVFVLKGTPKKHYALGYHCYYNIMYPHFESDSEKGCLAPNYEDVKPATKEQRDALIKAMTNAGYTFDFEKKELKKIEQKSAENKELTEFDKAVGVSIGTWNPKTPEQIRSVKAVSKRLLKLAKKQINDEQKPVEEPSDTTELTDFEKCFQGMCCDKNKKYVKECCASLLELARKQIQDEQKPAKWRQDNVEELTDFENAMMHIGGSFFGENAGLDPNDTAVVKEQAKYLIELVQKPAELSNDDKQYLTVCKNALFKYQVSDKWDATIISQWLENKVKQAVTQPKQEWSEEDKNRINRLIAYFEDKESFTAEDDIVYANWLKSLSPQNKWKPSEEQINALSFYINHGIIDYKGVFGKRVVELLEQLKKL